MEKNKDTPENTWKMSTREGEFEKALALISCIYNKIDFSENQNILIEYRPKERTKITFSKAK